MVDKNSHECQQLPQVFINIENNPFAITILCLTGLGICSIFIITVIFIRFNNTRVIRSSGRDLSDMILVGITVTFSCPFVFLTKPSVAICALRGLLPGAGFLTCYAPLFLKTNRIYRIFLYAKKIRCKTTINQSVVAVIWFYLVLLQFKFYYAVFGLYQKNLILALQCQIIGYYYPVGVMPILFQYF